MSDAPTSLRHADSPKGDDAALAAESKAHVSGSPALRRFTRKSVRKKRERNKNKLE